MSRHLKNKHTHTHINYTQHTSICLHQSVMIETYPLDCHPLAAFPGHGHWKVAVVNCLSRLSIGDPSVAPTCDSRWRWLWCKSISKSITHFFNLFQSFSSFAGGKWSSSTIMRVDSIKQCWSKALAKRENNVTSTCPLKLRAFSVNVSRSIRWFPTRHNAKRSTVHELTSLIRKNNLQNKSWLSSRETSLSYAKARQTTNGTATVLLTSRKKWKSLRNNTCDIHGHGWDLDPSMD